MKTSFSSETNAEAELKTSTPKTGKVLETTETTTGPKPGARATSPKLEHQNNETLTVLSRMPELSEVELQGMRELQTLQTSINTKDHN